MEQKTEQEQSAAPGPTAEELFAQGKQAEQATDDKEARLSEAVTCYRKAAEKGHAAAQFRLGEMYLDAEGVEQDDAEAVHWLQKSAAQDFVQAQNTLGWCYMVGRGVAENEKSALQWYLAAARQGYAKAQLNVGMCYADGGDGFAQDDGEAALWYRKAAEQSNAVAARNLGLCYRNGDGTEQNVAEAARLFRIAAEQDDPEACFQLASLSPMVGDYSLVENIEACKLLLVAAKGNHSQAQCLAGVFYLSGTGFPQDREQALYWLEKAVNQRNKAACYELARCYSHGMGVPKNMNKAIELFRLSASLGFEPAKSLLSEIENDAKNWSLGRL